MSRRTAVKTLPLEAEILEHGLANPEFYGFALAKALADGDSALTAHGTLYKALSRMTAAGLLAAEWEDHETAERAGRPRRRLYTVTGLGQRALAGAHAASRSAIETTVSLA